MSRYSEGYKIEPLTKEEYAILRGRRRPDCWLADPGAFLTLCGSRSLAWKLRKFLDAIV